MSEFRSDYLILSPNAGSGIEPDFAAGGVYTHPNNGLINVTSIQSSIKGYDMFRVTHVRVVFQGDFVFSPSNDVYKCYIEFGESRIDGMPVIDIIGRYQEANITPCDVLLTPGNAQKGQCVLEFQVGYPTNVAGRDSVVDFEFYVALHGHWVPRLNQVGYVT